MDDRIMAEQGVRHGGGCLCGAIRYQITADPLIMGYCHCWVCQKIDRGTGLRCGRGVQAGF